jgi:hypothetical protein
MILRLFFWALLLSSVVLQGHGRLHHQSSVVLRRRQMTPSPSLNATKEYDVQLYLDLEYVSEELAYALDAPDGKNSIVEHFCSSIQHQVRQFVAGQLTRVECRTPLTICSYLSFIRQPVTSLLILLLL